LHRSPPTHTLFPYTTLFRSGPQNRLHSAQTQGTHMTTHAGETRQGLLWKQEHLAPLPIPTGQPAKDMLNLIWRKNEVYLDIGSLDRKSTRLNSSHVKISYAV